MTVRTTRIWMISLGACLLGALSVLSVLLYYRADGDDQLAYANFPADSPEVAANQFTSVAYTQDSIIRETGTVISFADIAEEVLPSVVHITSRRKNGQTIPWYHQFFDAPAPDAEDFPIVSAGSGVILDPEGYIVTNEHVIKNSETLEVVLHDNRTFIATVVGADPSTDLALIKITGTNLKPIRVGSSAAARVGDWVLAVGNPFQLRSTVTAGIISAKGRNVNIISTPNRLAVESFIQTDAVVNRGNSGGALVNMRGELIGVNTAIFTETGGYQGYSFAVPSLLVRKVVDDLRVHGVVQRALLGVSITDVNAERAKDQDINVFKGVFVETVHAGSAAEAAGIKEKDIIIAVEKIPTPNVAALQEQIAIRRPGDQVKVLVIRENRERNIVVRLKGIENTAYLTSNTAVQGLLLRPLGASDRDTYDVKEGGVLLLGIENSQWRSMGLQPGLAITHINKETITSLQQAHDLLRSAGDNLLIEGVYEDGTKAYYGLPL